MEADYDYRFPDASMSLYVEWPAFAAFIEKKIPTEQKEEIDAAFTSGVFFFFPSMVRI